MRLMSDVPLGMFLSGGVDSSAIAALLKQSTGGPVKTFAVGYRESQFSELSYAARVARAIGTEHYETTIGIDDFFGALPRLIWHEDEPIAWPSSVALYFVSKLAAEQVKVVLTGEGSDELFAGYERYRWHRLNQRAASAYRIVPSSMRRWIRARVSTSRLLSASLRRKLGHTWLARDSTFESLFLDNFYCAFSGSEAGAAARLDSRCCIRELPGRLERPPRRLAACPHAVRRSENLSGRAAHEAGPDEHGRFDRKPRAVSRSHVGGVRRAHAGPAQAARAASRNTSSRRPSPVCCRAASCIAKRWDSRRRCASGCSIRELIRSTPRYARQTACCRSVSTWAKWRG